MGSFEFPLFLNGDLLNNTGRFYEALKQRRNQYDNNVVDSQLI